MKLMELRCFQGMFSRNEDETVFMGLFKQPKMGRCSPNGDEPNNGDETDETNHNANHVIWEDFMGDHG